MARNEPEGRASSDDPTALPVNSLSLVSDPPASGRVKVSDSLSFRFRIALPRP
jgi:hypothetical protein